MLSFLNSMFINVSCLLLKHRLNSQKYLKRCVKNIYAPICIRSVIKFQLKLEIPEKTLFFYE